MAEAFPPTEIRPQKGKQEQFLSSSADIVVYGGGAFSGKTYAELLEPLRHTDNPKFTCAVFRRTSPQITNPGALWDEAAKIYPLCGATAYESSPKSYVFPSGATVSFHHLQYDATVYDWQGAQVCLLEFDELTHFTEKQFFYMMSRVRSDCGIAPYVRATCNPDADTWVADFLQWWWDAETGLPIEERCGVIRYFVRMNDTLIWGDSREELIEKLGEEDGKDSKSITFISASIYDNPIGMKANPGYLASLKALPHVERERLLGRNWKIKSIPEGGLWKAHWFKYLKVRPNHGKWAHGWDIASGTTKAADETAGGLVGICEIEGNKNAIVIADVTAGRWSPHDRNERMRLYCELAKKIEATGYFEKGFGIGTDMTLSILEALTGYSMWAVKPKGSKRFRADPLAAQTEAGNVYLVEGEWNAAFVAECCGFTGEEGGIDNKVDAVSLAFNQLMR